MVILKAIDTLFNDDGSICGIPAFGGKIGLGIIKEVVEEDGKKELCYDEDGNLCRNYVLMFTQERVDGSSSASIMFGPNEICDLAGLPGTYAKSFADFMINLCSSKGSPIGIINTDIGLETTVPVDVEDGEEPSCETKIVPYNAMVFVNMLDIFRETHEAEKAEMENPDSTPSTYEKTIENNPGIQELVENHTFAKTVLGKICEQVQRAYNKHNYDDKIDFLAKEISSMSYFNDNGDVVPLTISALENLFSRLKDTIHIQ